MSSKSVGPPPQPMSAPCFMYWGHRASGTPMNFMFVMWYCLAMSLLRKSCLTLYCMVASCLVTITRVTPLPPLVLVVVPPPPPLIQPLATTLSPRTKMTSKAIAFFILDPSRRFERTL